MGIVYALTNPCMPGVVKIGSTDRLLDLRITELSASTGVPTPFAVLAAFSVIDHALLERRLHKRLENHRVSESREFFRLSEEQAVRALGEEHMEATLEESSYWNRDSVREFVARLYRVHFDGSKGEGAPHRPDDAELEATIRLLSSWDHGAVREVILAEIKNWDREAIGSLIDSLNKAYPEAPKKTESPSELSPYGKAFVALSHLSDESLEHLIREMLSTRKIFERK